MLICPWWRCTQQPCVQSEVEQREEGMECKSLAAEKSGTGAEREEEEGMEGWMEMSGRVDNEE